MPNLSIYNETFQFQLSALAIFGNNNGENTFSPQWFCLFVCLFVFWETSVHASNGRELSNLHFAHDCALGENAAYTSSEDKLEPVGC